MSVGSLQYQGYYYGSCDITDEPFTKEQIVGYMILDVTDGVPAFVEFPLGYNGFPQIIRPYALKANVTMKVQISYIA